MTEVECDHVTLGIRNMTNLTSYVLPPEQLLTLSVDVEKRDRSVQVFGMLQGYFWCVVAGFAFSMLDAFVVGKTP